MLNREGLVTKSPFGVVVLALASLLSACSPPPAPPAPEAAVKVDLAVEERAIRDIDARWLKAAQAGDEAGEAAVLARDSKVYREHVPPLVGPAAYQEFTAKFRADNPKAKPNWSTDTVQVAEAGDVAIQTGEYHLTGLGPKGDREDRGRFVTVWKKESGEWKVAQDIGSTTMPEATAKK
jgi:uncharacterized protein (TIGR02246 family)